MIGRRRFLQYLLATSAAAAVYRPQRAWAASGKARYVVGIYQRGGIDAIWSTDPKEPRDVATGVDLQYKSAEIVGTKDLRFGPHYKALVPWASRIAVIRGIRLYTANHDTGDNQMLRFRTNWSYAAPSLADVIGSSRDTQALSAMYLGAFEPFDQSSTGAFGEASIAGRIFGKGSLSLLSAVDDTDPEDLRMVARGLAREADRLARTDTSLRGQRTIDSWRAGSAFLDRVSKLPKFKSPIKEAREKSSRTNLSPEHFARAAWAIENDLARCVTIKCLDWDTHDNNDDVQRSTTDKFMPMFTGFLERLATTHNQHGSLLDQTMIYVGSELGRFPRLNTDKGKDHFPEANYMLVGSGFNAGTGAGIAFGGTGRDLSSLPIDPDTGRVAKAGLEADLDDLGTTLVKLAGVDPRRFGYSGRFLRFLAPRDAA